MFIDRLSHDVDVEEHDEFSGELLRAMLGIASK